MPISIILECSRKHAAGDDDPQAVCAKCLAKHILKENAKQKKVTVRDPRDMSLNPDLQPTSNRCYHMKCGVVDVVGVEHSTILEHARWADCPTVEAESAFLWSFKDLGRTHVCVVAIVSISLGFRFGFTHTESGRLVARPL